MVEFTRNPPSCSVGLKITCSAALGSGSTQPNWLLLLVVQVVEPLQHTGLLVMVRNWLPPAEVTVDSTACADRVAKVTDCGAPRLATCCGDFEFQLLMFQSQMPYSDWLPVAYVVGEELVNGICRPVPKFTMTRGRELVWKVNRGTTAVEIG